MVFALDFVTGSRKIQSLLDSVISVVGVMAIIQGWKQYNENLPKPTEEDQVTRVDYMSGNYEKELEEREEELSRFRSRGRFYVLVGSGLTLTGILMLFRLITQNVDQEDSSRPSKTK